ncbi:hypothetical protein HRO26_06030 [Treponema pectinovorum]|uniref:hypothetical protein n=1 Tax=Treponema pectinovorum TaxID=164 RepID=UPI003D920904
MVEETFLKSIRFQDLDKWYVEYYLKSKNLKSQYNMIPLKQLISPIKRLIKKDDYDGILPIVDKIVFKTGQIVFRKGKQTGMNLYSLENNELLVSNINFHQGATALNSFGNIAASTHYQPYKINKNLIDSNYLLKILRSDDFLGMVAGKKAQGIKNESGYEFIGNFKIPVPSIDEQKVIIQNYQNAITEAEKLENQADYEEDGIDIELLNLLSINRSKKINKSNNLLHFRNMSKCERWDVDYLIGKNSVDYIYSSKYPVVHVKDFVVST